MFVSINKVWESEGTLLTSVQVSKKYIKYENRLCLKRIVHKEQYTIELSSKLSKPTKILKIGSSEEI